MYKVWSISMCHNTPEIIEESLDRLQATRTKSRVDMQIIMIDQHWPIDEERSHARLKEIAKKNDAILLDPGRNLGLHKGFNHGFFSVDIPDNAMVIGYDPDSHPNESGWDLAMCDIFVSNPKVGWLSLWHDACQRELLDERRGFKSTTMAGYRVQIISHPVMNSVCGFRSGWLKKIGGLKEPNEFYGGLEAEMWPRLREHELDWVFLRDFTESATLRWKTNKDYIAWKDMHGRERTVTVSFRDWIRSRKI